MISITPLYFNQTIIIVLILIVIDKLFIGGSNSKKSDRVFRVHIDPETLDPFDLHSRTLILPTFRYNDSDTNDRVVDRSDEVIHDDIDDKGWWQVKYTSHQVFNRIRKYQLYIRRSEIDINMIHSCYEYKVMDKHIIVESSSFCYPSIIVTGIPKCSTSAMFGLLASSSFIMSNPVKENCLFLAGSSILNYFASLPKSIDPHHFYVDGCIDVVGNIMLRRILRNPNTFYIVMIRNYADMIWSTYNYWCDPKAEEGCNSGTLWADPAVHKRSPEFFHEILNLELNQTTSMTSIAIPHRVTNPCQLGKNIYRSYIDFLWTYVSKEATMVVSSEQLETNPQKLWKLLSERIGFPSKPEPNFQAFSKVRYNTQVQNERGAELSIDMDSYSPGKYPISGNKPLLSQTRSILNQCWHDDCVEISRLSGFQYSVCKDVPAVNTSQSMVSSSLSLFSSSSSSSLSSSEFPSISKLDNIIHKELEFYGYLKRQLRVCYSQYGQDTVSGQLSHKFSVQNMDTNAISGSTIITSASTSLCDMNATSTHSQSQFRRLDDDRKPIYSKQVLIICANEQDRDYLRGLLRFSFGQDYVYDSVSDVKRKWTLLSCDTAEIVTTDISYIERIDYLTKPYPEGKQVWFRLRSNDSNDPNSNSHLCDNRYFSRIIITVKDIFSEVWESFVRENFLTKTMDKEIISKFEGLNHQWNLWDKVAVDMLSNNAYNQILPISDISYFDNVTYTDKFMIVPSHLVMGTKKYDILRQLVSFIRHVESYNQNIDQNNHQNSISALSSKFSLNHSRLTCTFVLAKSMFLDLQNYFRGRHFLNQAYISKGLLCLIKDYFSSTQMSKYISYPRPFKCKDRHDNSSRIQTLSTGASETAAYLDRDSPLINVWKCDMRYQRRFFIEKIKHHVVAFISRPGQDSINVRLLFEHATGYHSGAVESDTTLMSIFAGEFACGQRLGIIHVQSTSATIALTRGITPAVRLPSHGRRKCLKGMIRGFTRAIVLVRDPFVAIWEYYLDLKDLKHLKDVKETNTSSLSIVDIDDFYHVAKAIASIFNETWLNTDLVYGRMSSIFNETDVFVVSHEALIYSENVGEYRTYSSGHNDRYSILSKMLAFTGHLDVVDTSRLYCAYSFLTIGDILHDLDYMVGSYIKASREGRHLICDIINTIYHRLSSPITIHHIFGSFSCS